MFENPIEFSRMDSREGQQPDLRIQFSPEMDTEIVQETLNELDELKAAGYVPDVPKMLEQRIAQGQKPSADEVAEAVRADFAIQEYEQESTQIIHDWSEQQADFLEKLSSLGLPLQSEYILRLTKYGVGGEYKPPNIITANIKDSREMTFTLAHEIIHLTIERLIKEYNIDHWTKERIVDRIFGKMYSVRATIQRDPPNTQRIDELIEQYFPNIQDAIIEIAQLKPEGR